MAVMLQRDQTSQRLYAHDVVIAEEPTSDAGRHLDTNRAGSNGDKLFITDILQNAVNVKGKSDAEVNSQKQTWDSDGNALTEGQKAFFANSKIRDAEGRLKVMYRGGNGDFAVFDRRKSSYSNLYGRGFYFIFAEAKPRQKRITL